MTPTSPIFTKSHPPTSKNITPSRFPAGHSALSVDFFLAALGYATRTKKVKVKGIHIMDISDLLSGPNDSGTLNSNIYRQYNVAMPPLHYQFMPHHLWRRVYNLRLNHPEEDIIIYKDDLVSALCSICYHPEVAAAYAFVLGVHIFIPVGMVFISIYAPSLFYILSELRSLAS